MYALSSGRTLATADIRADIYSLGCTLFFILTGKPPYGKPDFATNRKKLMAHAVAPIPSLADNCADVPAELEEVYEEMMAKNPDGRFSSPAEVAAAVAEFADAEELAEVIAAMPPHDVCLATDNTGVEGAGADTPRRPDVGSAGSPPRRRSQSRWASRQKFRRNVTIGLAAGATAAFCGLVAWIVMRPHDAPRDDVGQSNHLPRLRHRTRQLPPKHWPKFFCPALTAGGGSTTCPG